jgi:hypothetical protein
MKRTFGWYLIKIDRMAAWALLITMFLYFISGYGMTKGLIDNKLAINIHNNWLPLILIISFSIHTCYALSLSLRRWKVWNIFTKIILFSVYTLFFIAFVYINSFYSKTIVNESPENKNSQDQINNNDTTSTSSNIPMTTVAPQIAG